MRGLVAALLARGAFGLCVLDRELYVDEGVPTPLRGLSASGGETAVSVSARYGTLLLDPSAGAPVEFLALEERKLHFRGRATAVNDTSARRGQERKT